MSEKAFVNGLMELLHYNPESGVFYWKTNRKNQIKKGDAAGYNSCGYIRITINNKPYMAHQLAWAYIAGEFPQNEIDHINGVKDDNRFTNLRSVPKKDNLKNKRLYSNNKSGVSGVHYRTDTNKWVSQISINGRNKKLGCFELLEDAVSARLQSSANNNYHSNHGSIGETNVR